MQLQRASAGSGKTYMLAKKYIEYLISVRDKEDGPRRLRRPRELREGLPKILAITFTNKATNEMKLRIVDKLDALGSWTPEIPIKDVDYLQEFTKEFNCTPQEISSVCSRALKVLLGDYGDFKVSTIDSFFQTVLRTFAYEADLDDTYQLELDSGYVTQMGLDTTLDEIDNSENGAGASGQGGTWVAKMMEEKSHSGKGWNIFQKNAGRFTIYGQILQASRNLAKEDFKDIRSDLDRYFREHPDFYATYNSLRKVYETPLREAHAEMRKAARELLRAFEATGLDIDRYGGQHLATRARKMAGEWAWDFYDEKKTGFKIPEFTRKSISKRVFNPRETDNPYLGTETEDRIEALAIRMYEHLERWRTEASGDKMKRWRIYSATMPYVGLLQSVRDNSRLFLTDSNTVELSETNSILHRIIGEDDTPFVYERLGGRLEHFLIDEFQDTSRLQWINLSPLIEESDGKGKDNLIIGDAKQSIYRFRNADPGLITTRVPNQFAKTVLICGNTPAENTNWRSSRRIVEFNNLFFRFLTRELGPHMEDLYSNVVQPPHHKEKTGYVSVQLFRKESDEEVPAHFDEIPLLIADMIARGYRMRDIAVLVDTKEQGSMAIERIMAYNRERDPEERIEFISADSLKIGESPAVQSVIAILEAINNGTRAELRPPEERKNKGVGDWSRLRADFSFFAMQHPDIPLSEQLTQFLKGNYTPDAIRGMLSEMSTTVLPALVENIIQTFVPAHIRDADAPFLAVLMDSLLDFCDGHSADVASFLEWWEKKGRHASISSPEEADAVQVMTVHKSKGLEFRCVIVPYSKQTIEPISSHEKEWLWVRPDLHEAEGIPQIDWIPVWSDRKLSDTIHAGDYADYLRKYMTDKVNMAYVAYTRAVDELYIFSPVKIKDEQPASGTGRIGEYLWRCGHEGDEIISEISGDYPEAIPYIPAGGRFNVDEQELKWNYGSIPTREEVEAATLARKKKTDEQAGTPIRDYYCGKRIPALIYRDPTSPAENAMPDIPEEETEEEESDELRRFGEVMHSIMERVATKEDLRSSLLRMKTRGHISLNQMEEYGKILSDALSGVEEYGWFDAGNRVINERGIVVSGKTMRPDRIIIRPDGTAVIIDYKFGEKRNDRSYLRQVARYRDALLKSGIAGSCEAYVWYVTQGIILKSTTT